MANLLIFKKITFRNDHFLCCLITTSIIFLKDGNTQHEITVYLFFLEMAHSIEKEATYCCFDLDEVIDFSQKTLIEKSNMVDEIFSKQMRLGSKIGCQAFREYFLRKVDKVHKTYKDQIVFLFKGKIDI